MEPVVALLLRPVASRGSRVRPWNLPARRQGSPENETRGPNATAGLARFSTVLLFLLLSQGPPSGAQEPAAAQAPLSEQKCEAAAAAFRAGQIERAADLARLCILNGANNSEIYKLLALSSFLLQRAEDFQINMEKAIALNPGDADAHYHMGRFLYEKMQYDAASSRFRKAIELDPENHRARYYSGLCRQAESDLAGAEEDFRKAIEIIERKKAGYGWPFADLAELLVLKGNYEQGISWIYRGVRNNPTLPYTHYVYARALMRGEASFEVERELRQA